MRATRNRADDGSAWETMQARTSGARPRLGMRSRRTGARPRFSNIRRGSSGGPDRVGGGLADAGSELKISVFQIAADSSTEIAIATPEGGEATCTPLPRIEVLAGHAVSVESIDGPPRSVAVNDTNPRWTPTSPRAGCYRIRCLYRRLPITSRYVPGMETAPFPSRFRR